MATCPALPTRRRSASARLLGACGAALLLSALAAGARAESVAAPTRLELIDTPTAQTFPKGAYEMNLRMLGEGSALVGMRVGALDYFTFGFSYGGANLLGSGAPDWNPRPEFYAKLRVFREAALPGLALGFDSQGLGPYDDDMNRYEVKSRGLYVALEKTWPWLGFMAASGGVSVSFEDEDDDTPTFFVGLSKSLGSDVVFLAEYDAGLNDDQSDGVYGRGRGFLNTSFAWSVSEAVSLELGLRNLAENGYAETPLGDWNREIRIRYAEFF